jgi:hypothetical protein
MTLGKVTTPANLGELSRDQVHQFFAELSVQATPSLDVETLRAEDVEGIVRCYCGVKYWDNVPYTVTWTENGEDTKYERNEVRCADCGTKLNDELLTLAAFADRCETRESALGKETVSTPSLGEVIDVVQRATVVTDEATKTMKAAGEEISRLRTIIDLAIERVQRSALAGRPTNASDVIDTVKILRGEATQ